MTYRFDDANRAIEILRLELPSPWINYLSNGRMHALVSQAGGGFTWLKDPVTLRLTRYRQQHLPTDSPGFYIYLREPDGTVWSPTGRPCETRPEGWAATHAPGLTRFRGSLRALEAQLELFVCPDTDALVMDLTLLNQGAARSLDVFGYLELSQYHWDYEQKHGYYWRHMLKTWLEDETLFYLFHSNFQARLHEAPLVYFGSSLPIAGFCGDRDAFVGNYRDERNPLAVERGQLDNWGILSGEPCAALHHRVGLEAGQQLRLRFFLGAAEGALVDYAAARGQAALAGARLRDDAFVDDQRSKLLAWWDEHLAHFRAGLPDPVAERQINLWGPVNSVTTARFSRSVNAQAPGVRGIGFRDSCQDMLAIAYRKPEWATEMLLYLLSNQLEDGHGKITMYSDPNEPPVTGVHSDLHLWLPLLVYAILAETGNAELLQKTAPFLAPDHRTLVGSATVWEHLVRAMRFTEANRGRHGLPLTFKGDWNDIIGKFSERGQGESVFAGQQYVYALRLMIEMAQWAGNTEDIAWLQGCLERQEQAILNSAWGGEWWIRCFDDDGQPVGVRDSAFGKLWLNSQSWSVLSGVGSLEQQRQCMDAVKQYLDTGVGLRKLWPGFATWPEVANPFSGYNPGNGENGAIFCHANAWAIIAEALLGNGERAWGYFRQIIPHNALAHVGLERYRSEPYAWASNIVGPENPKFGWANVTHITGTAAWMDLAATQYLLGLRPALDGLIVDPCVPPDWKGFRVQRLYRGCLVDLEVSNPQGVQKGVVHLELDDKALKTDKIAKIPSEWLQGKAEVKVRALMGLHQPNASSGL